MHSLRAGQGWGGVGAAACICQFQLKDGAAKAASRRVGTGAVLGRQADVGLFTSIMPPHQRCRLPKVRARERLTALVSNCCNAAHGALP